MRSHTVTGEGSKRPRGSSRLSTSRDIARARLARQFLLSTPHRSASAVVRALGAVQAQDYPGAKWAISLRTNGLTDAAIEREMNAGRILRTHVLRPTWHFVTPEDIRWMLALTGPRVRQQMASYNRKFGLTEAVLRRAGDAIGRALEGGKSLTRAELREVLERKRFSLGENRMAHIMGDLELKGLLSSGPLRGKQQTYALLDERVPAAPAIDRDEALGRLAAIYFRTRAPATPQDFSWWSGLTVSDAKRAIQIASPAIERVTIEGRDYWQIPSEGRIPSSRTVHLLPNYDEFFIGHRDRSAIAQRLGSHALVTGGSMLISHVIVVDGQLVGGWRRVANGRNARVKTELLTAITTTENRLLRRKINICETWLHARDDSAR